MKKIYVLLVALGIAISFTSCSKCHKGDGPIVTIDKGINTAFTEVQVQGDFEVVLKTGPYQVKLITNENIGGYVDVFISGATLYVKIKDGECIKKYDKLKVEVYAPYYSKIRFDGSGKVDNEGTLNTTGRMYLEHNGSGYMNLSVNADSVYSTLDGSGNISLRGNTAGHFAELDGSGVILAEGLHAIDATASVNGSGQISIYATNSLIAGVNGSGLISYYGHPVSVDKNVNGSGSIVGN